MASTPNISISRALFGKTKRDQEVCIYTLSAGAYQMEVLDYGGIVHRLLVPDTDGQTADVLLGCETLREYEEQSPYFNCIIGRVGNRTAAPGFTLDGKPYALALNHGAEGAKCHLHGGNVGFDKQVWNVKELHEDDRVGLELSYTSPDGEENYPGELKATVRYWLTTSGTWRIEYRATTDKPTLYAPTHHAYFNLAGEGADTAMDHRLQLNADAFTPTNAAQVTTGEIASIEGTPLDFREAQTIGDRIDADHQQLAFAAGYDHNWILNKPEGAASSDLSYGGALVDPSSGRKMTFWTTEPGVQFYAGNFLASADCGKSRKPYPNRSGICLETQHFPDSANKPNFPSIVLRPGEAFYSVTEYRFSAE